MLGGTSETVSYSSTLVVLYNPCLGLAHNKTIMKSQWFAILFILSFQFTFSQFEIGMPVDDFLYLLKYKHKNAKSIDRFGTKGISFDYELKWKNSEVTNVILDYRNMVLIDLQAKSDVIINYSIQDGLIEEITFTYLDLPEKYIERIFDQRYGDRKLYGFYFTDLLQFIFNKFTSFRRQ